MTRNKIIKNGIKVVAFLLIFALLFQAATFVLCSKWTIGNQETYVAESFYELEDDSVDVLVLGSSQVLYGVSTVELYDYAGISACCLGGASTTLLSNYYWLLEVEKTQSPSVVMLEVSSLFEALNEQHERKQARGMKPSLNWLRFIRSLVSLDATTESFLSYLFPIIKFHSRWSTLEALDFGYGLDSSVCFRGYHVSNYCQQTVSYDTLIVDNDDPEADVREMYDYQLEYLEKIVAYCQENSIELLLFKTPKSSWTLSDSNQVQQLADSYGLTYLDYNWSDLLDTVGLDTSTDFQDIDHLNTRGADKYAHTLADYLTANYDLPDRREDKSFDLHVDRGIYDTEWNDSYLRSASDPVEWLTLLKEHTACDIFISTYGDTAGLVSDELAAGLADLGLETDLNALEEGYGFVAWLTSDGGSVEEKTAENYVRIEGTLDNGVAYQVVSRNQSSRKQSKQLIGGEDQSINTAGLNITLYDEEADAVIETVCIDLETGEMTCVLPTN
ncbi:MAG: hypothetical protein LUD78_07065 [Clostridiales bacterium]|nr:hypothetical protein [Clostridiales bacterium]